MLQPVTPILGSLRQENDPELAISLGYRIWLCLNKSNKPTLTIRTCVALPLCQPVLSQERRCPIKAGRRPFENEIIIFPVDS